ncbi:MAG TPA: hypothetical protein VHE35_03895, partial [Kofleriaceae bacterium]|nr:hypothetical protein [Kofleriaceae bacterium]
MIAAAVARALDERAAIGAPGAPCPLAADEVDRHAVRLVTIATGARQVELHRCAELPALLAPGDLVV